MQVTNESRRYLGTHTLLPVRRSGLDSRLMLMLGQESSLQSCRPMHPQEQLPVRDEPRTMHACMSVSPTMYAYPCPKFTKSVADYLIRYMTVEWL